MFHLRRSQLEAGARQLLAGIPPTPELELNFSGGQHVEYLGRIPGARVPSRDDLACDERSIRSERAVRFLHKARPVVGPIRLGLLAKFRRPLGERFLRRVLHRAIGVLEKRLQCGDDVRIRLFRGFLLQFPQRGQNLGNVG